MKNPEYFYRQTAEQLGIDLELVTKVNNFFWVKGVADSIRSGDKFAIYVRHIGTFHASYKRLRSKILGYIKIIKQNRKEKILTLEREEKMRRTVSRLLSQRKQLYHFNKNLDKRKRELKGE